GDGARWWLTASTYRGDMPVKPRPIQLVYRIHQGARKVNLKVTNKFSILGRNGEENLLISSMTAVLSERTGPGGKDGKATITYTIDELDMQDRTEKVEQEKGKDKEAKPDEDKEDDEGKEKDEDSVKRILEQRQREKERMIENRGFLEFVVQVDDKG